MLFLAVQPVWYSPVVSTIFRGVLLQFWWKMSDEEDILCAGLKMKFVQNSVKSYKK